jgi:hypothetical protein
MSGIEEMKQKIKKKLTLDDLGPVQLNEHTAIHSDAQTTIHPSVNTALQTNVQPDLQSSLQTVKHQNLQSIEQMPSTQHAVNTVKHLTNKNRVFDMRSFSIFCVLRCKAI